MTDFDQKGQNIYGLQQNAGRDIYTIFPKATWLPPRMIPPQAEAFVGREEELTWLAQQLGQSAGNVIGLCGPGGMGKTALAAEAVTRLMQEHDWLEHFPGGSFYYSFYGAPSLALAFEELARCFEEEPGDDPRRAAMRALGRRRTLLIFDGIENLEDSLALRQLGGTHVVLLLSRRRSDVSAHYRDLHLLSEDQAVTLLEGLAGTQARAADDRPSVKQLVQHMGGYPLALQLIGRYLSFYQQDVAEYLEWFEQKGLGALVHGEHQLESIPLLLQRTYASLPSNEQMLFALLGILAPAAFPLELVQAIVDWPKERVQQGLGSLVNLSILRRPDQGYEVSHPLIHTFVTEQLSSQKPGASFPSTEMITTWREQVLTTLTTHFEQSKMYDRNAFSLWQPHVMPLLSATSLTVQQRLTAARLFNTVSVDAVAQGRYALAEPLCVRALAICEQELGPHHPTTATSLNNLAELYSTQGKYGQAEPLYTRALAIREQELGPHHPDTATSLNNLASLYESQGKYALAEPLYTRALAICEQELGPHHPTTATSLNNQAELYSTQGKYAQAEPLYTRALAICEQELGPHHPDTATSLNNLASLYESQGKYALAEPLYTRAFTIYEQQLGPHHPTTATSLNNQADLYSTQGKYAQAEPLFARALAIREQELGAQHPDTALSLNNLASLYEHQGKYAQAEPLFARALAIREQELGPHHPDTALSLNNLAGLYKSQGKYTQAEPLYVRALAICEQQLGAQHPATATSLNNQAHLYESQGKYAQAEPLYARALAICESVLGQGHPSTQTVRANYTSLLQSMGHTEKPKQQGKGGKKREE